MSPEIQAVVVGVVFFALGIAAVKLLDWYTKRGAAAEAKRIVDQAAQNAATKVREAEIEIKERALQQKEEGEKELAKTREELRERERVVDKRPVTARGLVGTLLAIAGVAVLVSG